MNISSANINIGFRSPFVKEDSLPKDLIEKFRLDEGDVENEPVQAYVLACKNTGSYANDGHEGHILLDANKVDQYFANERKEKLSNTDLVDGVRYDARGDHYYLTITDTIYGQYKPYTISSKEPITKEYLQERHEKIQNFLASDEYKGTYPDTVIIDGKTEKLSYLEYVQNRTIAWDRANNETGDVLSNLALNKLLGNTDNLFDDAPEFEAFVTKLQDEGQADMEIWRRISKAVNSGLVSAGNQTYFTPLQDADEASYTLSSIKNSDFKDAVLETIGDYRYGNAFYLDTLFSKDFQSLLNNFALKENEQQNNSTTQKFTFTGDITIDENSSPEYKNFINNKLIDLFQDKVDAEIKDAGLDPNDPSSYDKLWKTAELSAHHASNYKLIIKHLEEKIDKDVEENSNLLEQYTRNTKQNPLLG